LNDNDLEKKESVWFNILDNNRQKVTHCKMLDLNRGELDNLKSFSMCKSKNVSHNNEILENETLPDDCITSSNYQVCLWFEDDLWTIKVFEYRVRWFNNVLEGTDSKVSVELVGLKFLFGSMPKGLNLETHKIHFFPLLDKDFSKV
jgi:hypothetical protein